MGPEIGQSGVRLCLRHLPDHRVEPGFVRPVKEGMNLPPGAVLLKRREGTLYDVLPIEEEEGSSGRGPSKVNSAAFRANWDATFQGPPN